jgi:hypothetical protein
VAAAEGSFDDGAVFVPTAGEAAFEPPLFFFFFPVVD